MHVTGNDRPAGTERVSVFLCTVVVVKPETASTVKRPPVQL
jgi:hypothetical protein